ncbi:hypothetical protein HYH02_003669 [Chlamydomonas schloesseri]|uniref:Uncharacterized protein n=1 Tax=Chlamydomonas schloesseri TaxID=2026947 RepID=A0A835WR42_9CHLO|nr:hypothetical protein HYH02_003669 [Chlamydomonas schloesseri]|eukprot:KAG2451894.1 hypothetical protein HYH02_003669 [Chlamydomonas schloesseri]
MSSLEREVAEKQAAFAQLTAENEALKRKEKVLEKVLSCRDEQLGMVAALEERCVTRPGWAQQLQLQHQGAGSQTEAASDSAGAGAASSSSSSGGGTAAGAGAGVVVHRSCFGSDAANNVVSGPVEAQEAFRSMKKEQVIPQYKAFLTEVSAALLHCTYPCCDSDNPIVQKVTAAVERMGVLLKHLVLLNSPVMRQLLSLNLETGQPASPPTGHWDVVVASLQLTPQQAADIAAVYELYRGLIAKVYEERRLILTALGHTPSPGGSGLGCSMDGSATSTFLQQLQMQAAGAMGVGGGAGRPLVGGDAREGIERTGLAADMELIDKLSANMDKEHSARTLLCCFFFGKVLAPPQFAKVAVYSYPYFPDSLAVATAVARASGARGGSGSGSLDGSR